MEVLDIAQLVTGISTLLVALVLVYQLRQQHKDSDIEMTVEFTKIYQSQRELSYSDNFSNLIYKANVDGLDALDEKEIWELSLWAQNGFRVMATEWRLGRMKRAIWYYDAAASGLLGNKGVRELYKKGDIRKPVVWTDTNNTKGILKIADDVYEKLSGEKLAPIVET